MSVEKFRLTHDEKDYTTFPNKLLQGLSNAEALGLYSYLSSLPPTWEFHKELIRKHFQIGRDKLEKLLQLLQLCKLVKIFQERSEQGRFNSWRLHVCNPRSFEPFTDFQETDRSPVNATSAPFTDLPFTANQLLVNSSYKENNTKQIKKENKQKSFCISKIKRENSKKHSFAQSMNQMASEKKYIEEHEKRKALEMRTPMPQELRDKIKKL